MLLEKDLNDDLHISYGDPDMKKVFPKGTVSVTYRRGKCLKKRISPSLYPRTVTESLQIGLVSVMRVDVIFVRIIWCSKMVLKKSYVSSKVGMKKSSIT